LPADAHKGTRGRVVVVGGDTGMAGAARMVARAAFATGAGLVHVACPADTVRALQAAEPDVQTVEQEFASPPSPALLDLVARADAVVLGPGLGRSEWARSLWHRVLAADLPLVVDADGLNLLAELGAGGRRSSSSSGSSSNWVLTPHPGEAGRLLGRGIADVQRDRLAAARALASRYGAVAVLKGACSLVSEPRGDGVAMHVCDYGNPGMGTAGVGDVLAGVLGGLLVQLRDVPTAARTGVLLHALAGDDAAADGERGLIASDLLPAIRRRANPT
jgi:NAD(P)H-hydrate epimerase